MMNDKKWTLIHGIIILCAIGFVLFQSIDFVTWLAPGDHGRDYYAFERVYEGDVPYRDFWWVYGPLMLYYYGLFFKFIGVFIPSIILGQHVIMLGCCWLIYAILKQLIPRTHALLAALWFIFNGPHFGFTYNHLGGIFCILLNFFFLTKYFKTKKTSYLFGCPLSGLALLLIKLNFGCVTLFGTVFSVFLIDRFFQISFSKQKFWFYLGAILGAPAIAFLIYYAMAHGLSIAELRQCFPYLAKDHPHNSTPLEATISYLQYLGDILSVSKMRAILVLICTAFLACFGVHCFRTKRNIAKEKIYFLLMLCGFWLMNAHEYLVSGVTYRILWSKPYGILIVALIFSWAIAHHRRFIRMGFYVFIIVLLGIQGYHYQDGIQKAQSPLTYLNVARGKVHIGYGAYHAKTITEITNFLNTNLSKNELFFILPYDPLYYFLTNKKSPTRQLIFFDHINIPEDQEHSIMDELETNDVNWILLSSRIRSAEHGLGVFGETYATNIRDYIDQHFEFVTQIGDWEHHPDWASNHGMAIFRRKK